MAKFVKPTVRSVEEVITSSTPTKRIEYAGRTCYNSFDKIEEGSDVKFCKNMIKSNHTAMIEFGTAIFIMTQETYDEIRYANFKYLNMSEYDGKCLVSGNIRAWRDFIKEGDCSPVIRELILYKFKNSKEYNSLFDDIEYNKNISIIDTEYVIDLVNDAYLSDEEKKKHKYYHFVIETDRGVMAELTRHRNSSFAIQSTRYVNYKTGVEFVYPHWYHKKVKGCFAIIKHTLGKILWKRSCSLSESAYKWMIRFGFKPQDARAVLPNSLKTIINISGNLENFEWIFHLRSAKSAHPDIRIISDKMKRYVEMYK